MVRGSGGRVGGEGRGRMPSLVAIVGSAWALSLAPGRGKLCTEEHRKPLCILLAGTWLWAGTGNHLVAEDRVKMWPLLRRIRALL